MEARRVRRRLFIGHLELPMHGCQHDRMLDRFICGIANAARERPAEKFVYCRWHRAVPRQRRGDRAADYTITSVPAAGSEDNPRSRYLVGNEYFTTQVSDPGSLRERRLRSTQVRCESPATEPSVHAPAPA